MTLRRISGVTPGYDCIRNPCGRNGCVAPDGVHGIHSDEWNYVVTDGEFALSATIFSGTYPETVPLHHILGLGQPKCAGLFKHSLHYHEERHIQYGPTARECEWIGDGSQPCFGSSAFGLLWSDEWFKKYGVPHFEQTESFWVELEVLWAEARAATARLRPCAHCGAKGYNEVSS